MSTPLKALIQERLRAKMVCRRPGYDLEDDYECDSDRILRQEVDVTSYDITSRGDDEDVLLSAGSRGSASRRGSLTQSSYPMRLHTHIDPSAYLVPSPHDDGYYPASAPLGHISTSRGEHSRQRISRYTREKYHDANVYDPPPRPEQQQHPRDHRRRHHTHHRVREQQPRYDPPSRGGYMSRQPTQSRSAVSPWHGSDYTSAVGKMRSITRSPIRELPSPRHSPTPRGHQKHEIDYLDHFGNDEYTRHHRGVKSALSSPRFTTASSSSHQTRHHDYHRHHRFTWKDRDHDFSNEATYEVRPPSPTRHHDPDDYPTFDKPVRQSPRYRKHCNLSDGDNVRYHSSSVAPSIYKPAPEEIIIIDTTNSAEEPERHSPPRLDMEIIEPTTKTVGRTRAWDAILSPESRLAAKAFVEKRQRRTEKSTPRTMATQRWLEVVDARASRHEAAGRS
ncbi:unnamed protein product [Phytophthora lilii]|uniref:Unnamed protein product n=1 Tax=Phytophthora lilii TaxID=2077276 RepID=A0A9W6WQX6_9STRA|nr:unnamed protein product [Phytophthora lilii]